MKTSFRLLVSLAVFSLFVACGPPDDPSKDNNSSKNGTNNGETNNANNTDPNNANNTPNNSNNTPNNTNNTVPNNENNMEPFEVDTTFYGQIGSDFDEHGGGAPTSEPLTNDANLAAVVEANTAMEEMTVDVDVDVAGAIVTATRFGDGGNRSFWVQDATDAVQLFLEEAVDETVKVGDEVNFKATQVGNFLGHPQVQAIENFEIVSNGNAVPVMDKTGEDFSLDDYNKIVRVGGCLSDVGESCGGNSTCWDMMHGEDKTVIFRSGSNFVSGGDCLTFVGPLQSFPGPNADSGTPPAWQLDHINFSWTPFMD